jgi:PAS domain S-box-containing protein
MAKNDDKLNSEYMYRKSLEQSRVDSDYVLLFSQIGLLIFFVLDLFLSKSYEKPSIFILFVPAVAVVNILAIRSGKFTKQIRTISQLAYYSILFILLVFIVPVFSIYLILLPFILFTSIYWNGIRGLLIGLAAITATITAGSIYQFAEINVELIWMVVRTSVLFLFGGIVLWRVLIVDFAEKKKLDNARKDAGVERDRMLALINSMDYAVIATNQDGEINLYNGATLSLLNTNKTLDKQTLSDVVTLVDSDDNSIDLIEVAKEARSGIHRSDVVLKFDDGDHMNLEVSVSTVRPSYGQQSGEGYVVTLKDITKQHSLEEERDDFISVTSHELRTPIAIAEANLSTALMEKLSVGIQDKTKALIEAAHDNVVFLANLVSDLATLSKAERKVLEIELTRVDPAKVIDTLKKDYEQKIIGKNLVLKVVVEKDLHSIISSELYIKEILQNLMTNAIKYTDSGVITIGARKDKNNTISFWVKDSGIGLSASDQQKLFSKFFRSEDYRTRKTGGTGLGLYITKKLAERIDGKITFESKLGQGSTFTLSVPALASSKSDQAKQTIAEVSDITTNL